MVLSLPAAKYLPFRGTRRVLWLAAGLLIGSTLASPASAQTADGRVELRVEVDVSDLWQHLHEQRARLDAAAAERAALRQRVAALADPPDPAVAGEATESPAAPVTAVDPYANADGFLPLPPPPADARVYYVAADGSDRHHGKSPRFPLKTPAAALRKLRDGHGDRVLFRAGDTFDRGLGQLNVSGRSAAEPLVLGVYGPREAGRPVFHVQGPVFLGNGFGSDVRHLHVRGLEAVAVHRDPHRPGFDPDTLTADHRKQGGVGFLGDDDDITVEDCVFRYFQVALVFQSDANSGLMRDVTLHRNLVVDSYGINPDYRSQGIFTTFVDGLTLSQNVFDHNGWNASGVGAERNKFNHNLYIAADNANVAVRGNLIARGSSNGLQLRCGGEVTGNVFVRNAIGFFVSRGESLVRGNLVLKSEDMDGEERGFGLDVLPCLLAVVEDNIVSQKRGSAQHAPGIGVNWEGPSLDWLDGRPYRVELRNNKVYDWSTDRGRGPSIKIDGSAQMLANENNLVDHPDWPDPTRDLGRYAGEVLGLDATLEAYLNLQRRRGLGEWDPEKHEVQPALRWVAEGFSRE